MVREAERKQEFCQYLQMQGNQFLKACQVYGWAVHRIVGVVPGMNGPVCRLEPYKNLRNRRRLSRSVPHSRFRDAHARDDDRFRSVDRPVGCPSSAYQPALLKPPRSRPEKIFSQI